MTTPLRRLRPGRTPENDENTSQDRCPGGEPPTTPVPVSGLVAQQAPPREDRATDRFDTPIASANGSAVVIRRMRFYRKQLTNPGSVNAIAAVAKQAGIIDTSRLSPDERIDLLRVLKVDPDFRANNLPLLQELANEVVADRGTTTQPAAVQDVPKGPGASSKTVASTAVAGVRGTAAVSKPADDRPASSGGSEPRSTPTAMQYGSVNVGANNATFKNQAEADAKWKERAQSSGMTTKEVIGSYQETTRLSLEYELYRFTMAERRGTELRVMASIRVGEGSETLPVLMRWDPAGAATIRLVGRKGPKLPAAHDTTALAKYLSKKGVTVADLGSWTASQLQEFVVAVKLIDTLDPKAVRALEGILLEYTTKAAKTKGGAPEEAVFHWHPQDKTKPTFLVRQQAFVEDQTQFAGSEPGKLRCRSTMTMAHELGHAVEDFLYRRLSITQSKAITAQAGAFEEYRLAKNSYQDAAQAANQQILRRFNAATKARETPLINPLGDLYEGAEAAINAVVEAFEGVTDHGQRPTLPKSDIDNAKRMLVEAPKLVAAEVRKHSGVALPYHPLLQSLVEGRDRLLPQLDSLNSAAEAVRKTTATLETVVYRPSNKEVRSKRLQNFIEFVEKLPPTDQKRVVGITLYAKQEWPKNPRELFAEAYALWLTDKPFLTSTAPEFATYFDQGMHLK